MERIMASCLIAAYVSGYIAARRCSRQATDQPELVGSAFQEFAQECLIRDIFPRASSKLSHPLFH
jgi:hypothetical protein